MIAWCYSYFANHQQVREMVEIITREFIQMAGNTGEVVAFFQCDSNWAELYPVTWTWMFTSLFLLMNSPDGAGAGQNSAQVHVDDEPWVAACDLWRRWPSGSFHWTEEAAPWTVWFNKWVLNLPNTAKNTVFLGGYFCFTHLFSLFALKVTWRPVISGESPPRCCAVNLQWQRWEIWQSCPPTNTSSLLCPARTDVYPARIASFDRPPPPQLSLS